MKNLLKKLFVILTIILITGCQQNINPCHTCKGLSKQFENKILAYYNAGIYTMSQYLMEKRGAENCETVVCDGNDYCKKHR